MPRLSALSERRIDLRLRISSRAWSRTSIAWAIRDSFSSPSASETYFAYFLSDFFCCRRSHHSRRFLVMGYATPSSYSRDSCSAGLSKDKAVFLQVSLDCGALVVAHVIKRCARFVGAVGGLGLRPGLERRPLLQCCFERLGLFFAFCRASVGANGNYRVLAVSQGLAELRCIVSIALCSGLALPLLIQALEHLIPVRVLR